MRATRAHMLMALVHGIVRCRRLGPHGARHPLSDLERCWDHSQRTTCASQWAAISLGVDSAHPGGAQACREEPPSAERIDLHAGSRSPLLRCRAFSEAASARQRNAASRLGGNRQLD